MITNFTLAAWYVEQNMPTYLGHIISSSVLGLVSVAKILVCCVIYLKFYKSYKLKSSIRTPYMELMKYPNRSPSRVNRYVRYRNICNSFTEIVTRMSFHYNHIVSQLYNCVYNWWKLYLSFITFLTPLVKSHLLNIQNVIGKSNIKLSLC